MKVFITGTAGFIGFHLAKRLLADGFEVMGYDAITDYYDVQLKRARNRILLQHEHFSAVEAKLEDSARLTKAIGDFTPDIVIHLAAQAGVRYSLENPRAYTETNLTGTFNLLEAVRICPPSHLLLASSSSVYGANETIPFQENDKADMPLTLYAATKKANESMAHSYAHIYAIPTTAFRFFTVYGPWGRPDMALFKFTANMLKGKPINIHNYGEMYRDFTYIDDLVKAIVLLLKCPPPPVAERAALEPVAGDSLSLAAPFRVLNVGNSTKVGLLDFVEALEKALSLTAKRNLVPAQPGESLATWADCSLLKRLTGYKPETTIETGVAHFVKWYRHHYNC